MTGISALVFIALAAVGALGFWLGWAVRGIACRRKR